MNGLLCTRWHEFNLAPRVIAMAFAAAWLTACGGGGDPASGSQAPPPGGNPGAGGMRFACPVDDGTSPDALAACGAGMVCVGYFDGNTVHSLAPLTAGSGPDWSPDGQRIAVMRVPEDSPSGIYLVDADGSGEQFLTLGGGPSWSSDGRKIAFVDDDGIASINVDGSGLTTLIRHRSLGGVWLGSPAWSPDGQQIAFVVETDPDDVFVPKINVMNADGSRPRRVTQPGGVPEGYPTWSPSGDRIAYHLSGFHQMIMTVDAVGGNYRSVVVDGAEQSSTAWSPDGTTIAYSENGRCTRTEAILLVGIEGGSLQLLVRNARQPAWSPDGTRIAFQTVGDDSFGVPKFPPVTGPAEVYARETPSLSRPLSRYVLYQSGRFELQFQQARGGLHFFAGEFTRTGQVLEFQFDSDDRWQATSVFDGDRLTVKYNPVMALSGFEDGVYVLDGS